MSLQMQEETQAVGREDLLGAAIEYYTAKVNGKVAYPDDADKVKKKNIRTRAEPITMEAGRLTYRSRKKKLVEIIWSSDERRMIMEACHHLILLHRHYRLCPAVKTCLLLLQLHRRNQQSLWSQGQHILIMRSMAILKLIQLLHR